MAQVCLLDSNRLSQLLHDALSWSDKIASLMVSAKNGSILAYAFRDATPSIKSLRTLSTTMTAAYTVASEDILIFEAQNTGAISVITPIADHILLAVTGPSRGASKGMGGSMYDHHDHRGEVDTPVDEVEDASDDDRDDDQEQLRTDLEGISQELASLLQDELADFKWPADV